MASRVDLIMKQFDKDVAEDAYNQQMKAENDPFNRAMYDAASAFEGARAGWEAGQIGVDMVKGIQELKATKTDRKARRIAKKLKKGKLPQALRRIDRAVSRGADPNDLVELLTKSVTNYKINANGETVQVVGPQPVTAKLQGIVQDSYVTYEQEKDYSDRIDSNEVYGPPKPVDKDKLVKEEKTSDDDNLKKAKEVVNMPAFKGTGIL